MADYIYAYLIAISGALIPFIFVRMVADIFRNFVFDIGK